MKRILFLSLVLLLWTSFAKAHPSLKLGVVKGTVLDAQTEQPLAYVSIVITDQDKRILTGSISDDQGHFSIDNIPEGFIYVEVTFIGYALWTKKIEISSKKQKIDLGKVYLSEDFAELDEVVVVAETSSVVQKIDRKVINVGKDLTTAGATASELLNNVQSVSVDSQTGNISLRGNENVRILIDGRPSNVSAAVLLQQIPSTAIKNVELITNPSAKYNPEGMSGIINIVLHKKTKAGFNATSTNGIAHGKNTRYNSAVDLNYKRNKINLFSNYGYNGGKRQNNGNIYRADGGLRQKADNLKNRSNHLLKLGLDYSPNKKQVFSFTTLQNRTKTNTWATSLLTDRQLDNAVVGDAPLDRVQENNSQTYILAFVHDFDTKGENLTFDLNFSEADNLEMAHFQELVDPANLNANYRDTIQVTNRNQRYQVDYVLPFSENSKLELGSEMRSNTYDNNRQTTQAFKNEAGEWMDRENSEFRFQRDIYSAYVNYNTSFDKLRLQLGTRFEKYNVWGVFETRTAPVNYRDAIFTAYPSAFLTYKQNEVHQFQVSYSRRVDRPSANQINPIRKWSTPLVTQIGNPDLRPQFTNSYEINYTNSFSKGYFSAGGFFRAVDNNITRVLNIDENDPQKIELSFANTVSNNRYGFEFSGNIDLSSWWKMNASSDLYIQNETGYAVGQLVEVTNSVVNVRVSNSFKATQKLRFQLFGMYRSAQKNIQFNMHPMWLVNTAGSLSLFDGKGTVTFSVNDVFSSMRFKFDTFSPIPQSGGFLGEQRTANLGFVYRFGTESKSSRSRSQRSRTSSSSAGGFM